MGVWILYGVIGVGAGILGGMLGLGGGIITVPCLFYLFGVIFPDNPFVMHMAIATSLAAMILNTAVSTWAHNKRHHVLWAVFRMIVPGIIVGSILGAVVANYLSSHALEVVFGLFLCILSIHFYRQKAIIEGGHKLPSAIAFNGLGCFVGTVSNLLGIGGGSLAVPLLCAFKIKDKNAIGTSAAITCVTTVCGSISYWIIGLSDMPGSPLGLINLAAFLCIGIAAALSAPIGVKLTSIVNPQKLRRLFALVLALTGLSLLI
ncbi:MAG: hypothetical protein RLZZ453_90 [Chlamydiota bacterium]|jgi:uncharacterized membrane protein YfcA